MIRIITLDWSGVPRKKIPYVTSKLVRFSLNFGGLFSDCNTFFVVDGLENSRKYDVLRSIFKCNGLKVVEQVSVLGEGQGRLFFLMTGMYDGYQVFKKGLNGRLLPVTGVCGDFKTAVERKLELSKGDPQHTYEIHGIYNLNNN